MWNYHHKQRDRKSETLLSALFFFKFFFYFFYFFCSFCVLYSFLCLHSILTDFLHNSQHNPVGVVERRTQPLALLHSLPTTTRSKNKTTCFTCSFFFFFFWLVCMRMIVFFLPIANCHQIMFASSWLHHNGDVMELFYPFYRVYITEDHYKSKW